MSEAAALPWRPLGDVDAELAAERLAVVLRHYGQRWFTESPLRPEPARLMPPGAEPPPALQPAGLQGLVMAEAPRPFEAWARRSLDLPPHVGKAESEASSARLLEAFAERMRLDLIGTLAASCPADAIARADAGRFRRGAVRLPVALQGLPGGGFEIWCPLAALMIWRPLSPPRPQPAVLERRQAALADSSLRVEALVGRVRLAASHLVDLEAGDVLVLDQPLSEPCRLREPESRRELARGRLRRSAGRLAIELHPL